MDSPSNVHAVGFPALAAFSNLPVSNPRLGLHTICARLVALCHSREVESRMFAKIKGALAVTLVASRLFNTHSGWYL
jgi:hypothetical protein